MRKTLFLLLLSLFYWQCKHTSNTDRGDAVVLEPEQGVEESQKVSPVLLEMAQFAEVPVSDTTNIDEIIAFKLLDKNGGITSVDAEGIVTSYKNLLSSKQAEELPILEVKNTDRVVLSMQDRGYAGAIFAKVLVDTQKMTVEKIEFEHRAESEGYGAGITYNSFENQFVGAKIDLTGSTFGLNLNNREIIEGEQQIDGISGATATNLAVVEMVNEGLKKYSGYLTPVE